MNRSREPNFRAFPREPRTGKPVAPPGTFATGNQRLLPGRSGAVTRNPLVLFAVTAILALASLVTAPAGLAQNANPLRPQKAYPYKVQAGQDELVLRFDIVDGYYLYRHRFGFDSRTTGIQLGTPNLPPGQIHEDEFFGKQQIYRGALEIAIPYTRDQAAGRTLTLEVRLQGCADIGLCYPPQTWTRDVVLPPFTPSAASTGVDGTGGSPATTGADRVLAQTAANTNTLGSGTATSMGAAAGDSASAVPPQSDQARFTAIALGGSWFTLFGLFYVAGLALALTPCVLPLVPIISGLVVGQRNGSNRRAVALSVSYVLGLAFTYTVAGAAAALVGQQLQAVFQKPWIITLFAGLFVLLALAMFGAWNLQMPAAIQTRLAGLANRQRSGSLFGTAAMGALSALIVTTCVAPALVGALAVIGQQGDVVRGAAALFAMSIGMGTPLLLIGASAGALVPKAGPWMNVVKAAFGIAMLGVAIWMMERVLPGRIVLVLWAVLVFLTGMFLGAFDSLPAPSDAKRRLSKGVGLLACLYGALMLIGATLGGEDPLRPFPGNTLSALAANGSREVAGNGALAAIDRQPTFQSIASVAALKQALDTARTQSRPVLVDVTADWCVSCKEMEKYTFPAPSVVAALEPYTLLRIDVTANTAEDQALLHFFDSYGPPTMAFFDSHGTQQKAFQLVGFVPADRFAAHVRRLAAL